MRGIINKTYFKADQKLTQDGVSGQSFWLGVLKASFDISKLGAISIAEEQLDIFSEPVFRDDPEISSLLYESDFVVKPKIDFLLNARCYAPENEEISSLLAGFSVNGRGKLLKVFGSRDWFHFMGFVSKNQPRPFLNIPIIYELAYGGYNEVGETFAFEKRNPVGVGYSRSRFHMKDLRVPQIEYPDKPSRYHAKKNHIAGFGPICAHWFPRCQYAGTYDDNWKENRYPLLPLDFNPLFYQCAPEDQWFDSLAGDEEVTLFHLYPNKRELSFTIPEIHVNCGFMVNNQYSELPGKLQTIIVEPDVPRLVMVWAAAKECTGNEDTLDYLKFTANIEVMH